MCIANYTVVQIGTLNFIPLPFLERIRTLCLFLPLNDSALYLLGMLSVQVLEQNIAIPLLALVPADIVAPRPDGASQSAGDIWFLRKACDWTHIGSYGKHDTTGSW